MRKEGRNGRDRVNQEIRRKDGEEEEVTEKWR